MLRKLYAEEIALAMELRNEKVPHKRIARALDVSVPWLKKALVNAKFFGFSKYPLRNGKPNFTKHRKQRKLGAAAGVQIQTQ